MNCIPRRNEEKRQISEQWGNWLRNRHYQIHQHCVQRILDWQVAIYKSCSGQSFSPVSQTIMLLGNWEIIKVGSDKNRSAWNCWASILLHQWSFLFAKTQEHPSISLIAERIPLFILYRISSNKFFASLPKLCKSKLFFQDTQLQSCVNYWSKQIGKV